MQVGDAMLKNFGFICSNCKGEMELEFVGQQIKIDTGQVVKTWFIIKPCQCASIDDKTIGDALDALRSYSSMPEAGDCDDLIQRLRQCKKEE